MIRLPKSRHQRKRRCSIKPKSRKLSVVVAESLRSSPSTVRKVCVACPRSSSTTLHRKNHSAGYSSTEIHDISTSVQRRRLTSMSFFTDLFAWNNTVLPGILWPTIFAGLLAGLANYTKVKQCGKNVTPHQDRAFRFQRHGALRLRWRYRLHSVFSRQHIVLSILRGEEIHGCFVRRCAKLRMWLLSLPQTGFTR